MFSFDWLGFLKEVDVACSTAPEDPAVLVVSDLKSVPQYMTYFELSSLSNKLSSSIFDFISLPNEGTASIGLSIVNRQYLLPIILAIWKSGYGVAPLESHAVSGTKFESLCCDSEICLLPATKLLLSFFIDDARFFVYGARPTSTSVCKNKKNPDICYELTTSGSTGCPKLVKVPWSCILPNAMDVAKVLQISRTDVILSVVPPTFDPFFIDLFCTLTSGAALLFLHPSVPHINVFLPDHLCWNGAGNNEQSCMTELRSMIFKCNWRKTAKPCLATILQITPSMLYKLFDVEMLLSQNSSLRRLVLGGERFPVINVPCLCKCKIFNIYGVTEVSCWAFIYEVADLKKQLIPLGKPLTDIYFKIIDGELWIGSSRRCFLEDEKPESLPSVVYRRTGDIVNVNNEEVYFVTRSDNVIKKHGNKVDIMKIHLLLSRCKFLKDFAVVFNVHSQLVAWFLVFLDPLTSAGPSKLTNDQRHLIENSVLHTLKDNEKPDCLFKVQSIPLTSHGKKDLRVLRNMVDEMHSKRHLDDGQLINDLWCEILHVDEIPSDATFLGCGGNSVLALSLISRLAAFGLSVPTSLLPHLLSNITFKECLSLLRQSTTKKLRKADVASPSSKQLQHVWNFDMKKCVDATPILVSIRGSCCVVVGSHSHLLCAINCSNGVAVWTTKLSDRIEAGVCPSLDGKLLVVGCYDGIFYCIASETGAKVWMFHTDAMIKSSARLSNDGRSIYVGSYDKNLYQLSLLSGVLIRSIKISNGAILGRPELSRKDRLYCGTLDGSYVCLDAITFETVWMGCLSSPIFSSPCLLPSDDAIIFTEVKGVLHCFDVATGSEKWQYECSGNIFSALAIIQTDSEEYVTFGCHDHHIYLLQTQPSPKLKWKREMGSPVYGTPSYENGLIACAETKGRVYLLSLTGDLIASFKLDGEIFSSPILSEKRIYFGCRNNFVTCLSFEKTQAYPIEASLETNMCRPTS